MAGEPSASGARLVRRAQTAASSDRRRARADQTGGRRSARPRERARSRRGARGARGPEEGRGDGWERLGAARNQFARPGGGAYLGPAPLSWCAWPTPASGRAQSLGSDGGARTRWQYLQREPRGPCLPRWGGQDASSRLFSHSSSRGALSLDQPASLLPQGKFNPDLSTLLRWDPHPPFLPGTKRLRRGAWHRGLAKSFLR